MSLTCPSTQEPLLTKKLWEREMRICWTLSSVEFATRCCHLTRTQSNAPSALTLCSAPNAPISSRKSVDIATRQTYHGCRLTPEWKKLSTLSNFSVCTIQKGAKLSLREEIFKFKSIKMKFACIKIRKCTKTFLRPKFDVKFAKKYQTSGINETQIGNSSSLRYGRAWEVLPNT